MTKSLMIVGTSSSCGKSFITTALLRLLRNKGYSVAPFKAQNISLNSFITNTNDEIAYSTYIQALSAGVTPECDMNPVLIKPAYDKTQFIINGKLYFTGPYTEYSSLIPVMKSSIEAAYQRLSEKYDMIIIEGAGSPVEINMSDEDIPNRFTAEISNSPLLLVADIHYGGVFASIYGTLELLDERLRDKVKGFIINRYQGDKDILAIGIDFLEQKFTIPSAGIIPYQQQIVVNGMDKMKLDNNLEAMAYLLETNLNKKWISCLLDITL